MVVLAAIESLIMGFQSEFPRAPRTAALVLGLLSGAAAFPQSNTSLPLSGAIADVVSDHCDTQLLFLGEVNHGGGKTIEVKSAIVRDLVLRCGFEHVVFESQFYDFVDLQDKYVIGAATKEGLLNAIGGLWAVTAEIDELVTFLHGKASVGTITISGMDGQTGGSMGYYSQRLLGNRLGGALTGSRREFCAAHIDRLNGWTFDRQNPKSADFDSALLTCAKEIEDRARSDAALYQMARSYRTFLEFSSSDSVDPADRGTRRDRLMYENLMWSIDRLPRGTKTVVWTANIHSLRIPFGRMQGLASNVVREDPLRGRSVVVVAAAGAYRAPDGRVVDISAADADSLEGRFAPRSGEGSFYIDGDALQSLGPLKSRMTAYDRYVNEDWGSAIDGMVVIALEVPPTHVRSPRPLQAPINESAN